MCQKLIYSILCPPSNGQDFLGLYFLPSQHKKINPGYIKKPSVNPSSKESCFNKFGNIFQTPFKSNSYPFTYSDSLLFVFFICFFTQSISDYITRGSGKAASPNHPPGVICIGWGEVFSCAVIKRSDAHAGCDFHHQRLIANQTGELPALFCSLSNVLLYIHPDNRIDNSQASFPFC